MEIIERIVRLFENPTTAQVFKTIFYFLGIIAFFFIPKILKAAKKFLQEILDGIAELKRLYEELKISQSSSDSAIENILANGKGEAYAKHRDNMKDILTREADQRKINEQVNKKLREEQKFKWTKLLWPFGMLVIIGMYFIN
jgi:F0F1-type ATP synthase membrane subunit b/b'